MRTYRLNRGRSGVFYRRISNVMRQPLSYVTRRMISQVYESEANGLKDVSVCFTGHRSIPADEQEALVLLLDKLLEALYQLGFRRFISGGAMGFDLLAAERVCLLRARHGDVQLHMAIPCSTQSAKWPPSVARQYERILYHADHLRVLSPEYYRGCMHQRNYYMVDSSAFCLCYLTQMKGGTMSTVAYAMQQSCPVLNLAMAENCSAFIQSGGLDLPRFELPFTPFPEQQD